MGTCSSLQKKLEEKFHQVQASELQIKRPSQDK
jgi:hypothetical protein